MMSSAMFLIILFGSLISEIQAEVDCQRIRCSKGEGWNQSCYEKGTATCMTCQNGTYQDDYDIPGMCKPCNVQTCESLHRVERTSCRVDADRTCSFCLDGFFGRECSDDPADPCFSCYDCALDKDQVEPECKSYHQRERDEAQRRKDEAAKKKTVIDIGIILIVMFSSVVIVITAVCLFRKRPCFKNMSELQTIEEGVGFMCEDDAVKKGQQEVPPKDPPQAESCETLHTEDSGPISVREPTDLLQQLMDQPFLGNSPDYEVR